MAELLVRVVDKVQPDSVKAERLFRAGDVIVVCPDGWPWTPIERTNPEWRIISVDVLQTTIDTMLARSQDASVRRRREWKMDFSLAPVPSAFEGPRISDIIVLTRSQVAAMVVQKAAALGTGPLGTTVL